MKKTCTVSLVALVAATFPIHAQPAFATTNAPDYEELPELKASEILRPEILSGPHHKVQEPVPTYSGSNHFSIESDFGVFEDRLSPGPLKRTTTSRLEAQMT